MNNKKASLALALSVMLVQGAVCATPISKIRIDGLQRIPYATVERAITWPRGQSFSTLNTAKLIKQVYATGFFNYVELKQEGKTLVVQVMERATIGDVVVRGNEEIPKDQFKNVLKQAGLVRGEVFNQAVLESFKRELTDAYIARGKQSAVVNAHIKALPHNRVSIEIDIKEGKVAQIKEIKIIGHHAFSAAQLRKEFQLSSSNLFTWFTKKDHFEKDKWEASLQALQTYYLDRGYIKMRIVSSAVTVSEDKKSVYITVNIEEGPQYHLKGYRLSGHSVVPLHKLEQGVKLKSGSVFSREAVKAAVTHISEQLGAEGYGLPQIQTVPQVDETDHSVFLNILVEAGERLYVRHIHFEGNTRTSDQVLRSALRQSEAALLNVDQVKQSERQLRLLGYLKNISVDTRPVPNTRNQIDLHYKVEEDFSSDAVFSVGYSTNGMIVSAGYNERNFMGSGKALGLNFSHDKLSQEYRISYFNPYFLPNGVGAGFSTYYSKVKPDNFGIGYNSDRMGGELSFHYELSDDDRLLFSSGFRHMRLNILDAVRPIKNKKGDVVDIDYPVAQYVAFAQERGRQFNQILLSSSWSHVGLDQAVFPTRGYMHRLGGTVFLPAQSQGLKYYKADYLAHAYLPLPLGSILSLRGVAAFGNGLGNTDGLPFFEYYYAGGAGVEGQLRGYDAYSVGPMGYKQNDDGSILSPNLDKNKTHLGGNALLGASVAWILPPPFSNEVLRPSLFYDIANVYQKGQPARYMGTASGPFRQSTGLSVIWRSPFGSLEVGYARAIHKQPQDETQRMFFSIHSSPL